MSRIMQDITDIARCTADCKADKLAPLGLKPCHANYLEEICKHPGISQDQLAKRIYINKSNVARQLVFLEESGYVHRCSCTSDKRVMQLYPTEKALEVYPQIEAMLQSWEDYLTAGLTDEEKALLFRALANVKTRAGKQVEK